MKKTESRKSRDTVPLSSKLLPGTGGEVVDQKVDRTVDCE
jgi:hypothetical protein